VGWLVRGLGSQGGRSQCGKAQQLALPPAQRLWAWSPAMDSSLVDLGQGCAIGIAEITQRVLMILCDVVLILYAASSINEDWWHFCDEALHLYGLVCVMLCMLDIVWEFVRCTLESSLDRLQQDFRPEAAVGGAGISNENLLNGQDSSPMGSPSVRNEDQLRMGSPGGPGSTVGGALGQGVRKEKASKQKRTNDLHFWSIVFTSFVAVTFALFSAHDEECALNVPHLYNYIHTFTYVFIFRLGVIIVAVCCRTVKDYEDAALSAGTFPLPARQRSGVQLVSF